MVKKLLATALIATSLLGLTGCGSSSSNEESSSKEKELQVTIDSQSKEIEKLKEELAAKENDTDTSVNDYSEYKAVIDENSFKILHDNGDTEYPNMLSFKAKITNDSKELLPFSTEAGKPQVLDMFSATQESSSTVYDLSGLMWNMDYDDIKMKPKSTRTFEFHFELKNTKDKVIIISDYMDHPVTVDVSKLKTENI